MPNVKQHKAPLYDWPNTEEEETNPDLAEEARQAELEYAAWEASIDDDWGTDDYWELDTEGW